MERNVTIVKDLNGKNIVLINDIYFKGRQNIEWKEVEKYLKRYVGEFIEVAESKDIIYIGNDLPDEFAFSDDTKRLKGWLRPRWGLERRAGFITSPTEKRCR